MPKANIHHRGMLEAVYPSAAMNRDWAGLRSNFHSLTSPEAPLRSGLPAVRPAFAIFA
jgi:hypothetical protein